jgi:hypothetical protein
MMQWAPAQEPVRDYGPGATAMQLRGRAIRHVRAAPPIAN